MNPERPAARAVLVRAARPAWVRLLPLLALVAALYLALSAWGGRGPRLIVHANNGHGLRAGDPLLYRGIAVGDVTGVELSEDLAEVLLTIRLDQAAAELARAGSRFWIVRPQLGLDRVGGLETLLGARHLAVLPGPAGSDRQREFVALAEPPVLTSSEPGSLEIVLEAPRTRGLAPGAPVVFRDIEIGTVLAVGLSGDATAVELRASIRSPFVPLVREDTRFWETGGFEVSFGLTDGFDVRLDSLRGLLVGAVALATPTHPGGPVRTGHRFPLYPDPDAEWLSWRPALPLGSVLLPAGLRLPEPLRARLDWETGLFNRRKVRAGWLLATPAGLLGPADLLVPPPDAESPALELRGDRLAVTEPPDAGGKLLAMLALVRTDVSVWPAARVRSLGAPEELLVAGDPGLTPIALSADRLTQEGELWRVDPAISFEDSWHGAAVVARADGSIVGLLLIEDGAATIAPVAGFFD